MNLTPERLENETFDQYKARRTQGNQYSRNLEKGWATTMFVQHVNDRKNPLRKWPRSGRFITDGNSGQ